MTLREELNNFYKQYNIPDNGGMDFKSFEVPLPFFSIWLPNYSWRKKMLYIHDLEHILNRQDTTWSGEIFIASWEIATGFWKHFPVCIFPLWTIGYGTWKHPSSIISGFRKGLNNTGITSLKMSKNDLLSSDIIRLRSLAEVERKHFSKLYKILYTSFFAMLGQVVFLSPLIVFSLLLILFF